MSDPKSPSAAPNKSATSSSATSNSTISTNSSTASPPTTPSAAANIWNAPPATTWSSAPTASTSPNPTRLLHDPDFRRNRPNSERRDVADGFHAFAGPTLLVRGERSNILEADAATAFVGALPDARLVEVPDCGHNVHSQNTPGFLDAVAPFLTAAATTRAGS